MEKKKKYVCNKWLNFKYKLPNLLLSSEHITGAVSLFEQQILLDLSNEHEFFILFKLKIENGPFRNISHLQRVNKSELSTLTDIFKEYWSLKSSEYNEYVISDIIFTYFIFPSESDKLEGSRIKELNFSKSDKNKSVKLSNGLFDTINFGGYTLPASMDITTWGVCDFSSDFSEAIIYKKKSKGVYHVKLYETYLDVDLKINNKIVLSFKDTLNDSNNLGSFTRVLKDQTYVYVDSILKTKSKVFQSDFIETKQGEVYLLDKFITMDLESRVLNGKMEIIQVSIYDGKIFTSFYLKDFLNSEDLLKSSLNSLMLRKYRGYVVYLHNFSNFDGIFLLKIIASISPNSNVIMKDNTIISVQLKYYKNTYTLTFRDSFLMLPSSLKKLAQSFNVEDKLVFPYSFVNNVELDYNGAFPDIKYYERLSLNEYLEMRKNFKNETWNLREEIKQYCERDVKILYLIISQFSRDIFYLFRVNVLRYPTISSLSFAIFRTIFLKDSKIPILTGDLYKFIKKGYSGGAVDVFKPFGRYVYRYDVNSLYPYIMKEYDMPTGFPTLIEGDLSKLDLRQLSFIETTVISPEILEIPFLQTKIKSKNGDFRTASPLGSWRGIYTNNEIIKAMELGYKFKFIRAVTFKGDKIFTEFVDYFYKLKKESIRNSSSYIIAKFFLNSLSGRFALEPILDKHVLANNEKIVELSNKQNVKSVTPLTDLVSLVSFREKSNENDIQRKPNVSVAISAMITSNARLWMYQFKNNDTLYTDTDSIDTTQLLDPKWVGDELGQFKLEHFFQEAIYLAPKVHGGFNKNREIVKIKGLKNNVPYKDLKPLLFKGAKLDLTQEKWMKNIAEGNITIKNEIYSLMVTDNKRELIYDNNNKLIGSKPLIIQESENI